MKFVSLFLVPVFGLLVERLAPIEAQDGGATVIPGKFIVSLKPTVSLMAHDDHHDWLASQMSFHSGNTLEHKFQIGSMKGYIGTFSASMVETIRSHPQVDFVEMDSVVSINRNIVVAEVAAPQNVVVASFASSNVSVQDDAPWGLSRISHRTLPAELDTYEYPVVAGKNVTVYVIDTGVYVGHEEFEGRAKWGKSFVDDPGFEDVDGNGHGTHCAGTIGGKTYGVAKKASIVAVKVLSSQGSGSLSGVIKGMEYVAIEKDANPHQHTVASMSLGGGKSRALEQALESAAAHGIHFAVAAGNENQDACRVSPAGSPVPITVGATTNVDGRAWFSNYGKCVDIFAPGVNILSSWIGAPDAVNTISGTSMATPHTAGVIALYLSTGKYSTPKEVKDKIISDATKDILTGIPKKPMSPTPNLLLNINNLL